MKRTHNYSISFGRCLLAAATLAASLSVVRADTWDKKTTVSFSQPVEVPGHILQPGKYVMKLVDSQSDRHVVQFTNERQNHVYATTIAVPAYRTQVISEVWFTGCHSDVGAGDISHIGPSTGLGSIDPSDVFDRSGVSDGEGRNVSTTETFGTGTPDVVVDAHVGLGQILIGKE